MPDAVEDRNALLHHFTDVVAEQPPVRGILDFDFNFDQVGAKTIPVQMVPPVGNLTGEHRGAGALAALGIGASAEHRIAVDDGRRFHPGAVLAFHRDVADLVRGAGVEELHAEPADEGLALAVQLHQLRGNALLLGVIGVDALLQVRAVGLDLGNLNHLGAVQAEFGEHRIEPAGVLRSGWEGWYIRSGSALLWVD